MALQANLITSFRSLSLRSARTFSTAGIKLEQHQTSMKTLSQNYHPRLATFDNVPEALSYGKIFLDAAGCARKKLSSGVPASHSLKRDDVLPIDKEHPGSRPIRIPILEMRIPTFSNGFGNSTSGCRLDLPDTYPHYTNLNFKGTTLVIRMPSTTKMPIIPPSLPSHPKGIVNDPLPSSNRVIEAPLLPSQSDVHAARLVVIRRIKMNKHKLRKLRRRMKYIWEKIRLRRATRKEKLFLNQKMEQVKAAWKFDAKSHVAELIRNVRDNQPPHPWIRKGMPDAFVKEQIKIREEKKRREFLSVLDKRPSPAKV